MVDLHLGYSIGDDIGSLWCCRTPGLASDEEPYMEELLWADGADLSTSMARSYYLPEGERLGDAIRNYASPRYRDISYAPGVDPDWIIYELTCFPFHSPLGVIRIPNIDFVGVLYHHGDEHQREELSETKRREALAACHQVYD